MTSVLVTKPFQIFTDVDGRPLENGRIYIGAINQNPQVNPIAVFWDQALTIPASQPIRTIGGYSSQNGTPGRLYTSSDYSITVRDKKGKLVFTAPTSAQLFTSDLITFTQAGAGAVTRTSQDKMRDVVDIRDFGAVGGGVDETIIANTMIAEYNRLYVPSGFVLTVKNVELFDDTEIICDGTLRLPGGCNDFDRLLKASLKKGISINCREIDGNYAGQTGNIGTHLIYLQECANPVVNIKYAHDHYISSSAVLTPSGGAYRDTSSGAILLYRCTEANVNVGLLEGWSREGVYLQECNNSQVTLGHAQGKYLTEYSGLQVSGTYNNINRASVDNAGASAVGFDTVYGSVSNIIATNTRENSGVNFGHAGLPASGSVANNIVVDGSFGAGITVLANSQDVSINNFSVQNTGESGIQFSDGVVSGKLSNGSISRASRWNLVSGAVAEIQMVNVKSGVVDAATLLVNVTSGSFADGETVTSIGGAADIRKSVKNLTGSQQRLFFFSNVPASYVVGNAITSSGGAIGTIAGVYVPEEYNEAVPGRGFLRDPRSYIGNGMQIRFPDGAAFYARNFPCEYTTAGALQSFNAAFSANELFIGSPVVTATISSVNSTSAYSLSYLMASANSSAITVNLNASVNQTYGVSVIAVGRWK